MKANISNQTPRNEDELRNIPFKKGLKVYFFFAAFLMLGVVMLIVSCFFPPFEKGLIFFKLTLGVLFFFIFSLVLYMPASKRLKRRKLAFKYGKIITGTVVKHKRRFVVWSSTRDYVAIIAIETQKGDKKTLNIQNTNAELFQILPIGSKINVLHDDASNTTFAPIEIGVEI